MHVNATSTQLSFEENLHCGLQKKHFIFLQALLVQHNAFISNMKQIVGQKLPLVMAPMHLGHSNLESQIFEHNFPGSDLSIMIQTHQRLRIENIASSVKTANLYLTSTVCSHYTEGDLW